LAFLIFSRRAPQGSTTVRGLAVGGGFARSSLGCISHLSGAPQLFDRLFDLLDQSIRSDWPPYNIEKKGEDQYRITMTVAGFAPKEIELVQHAGTLLVTGQKGERPELLHQGIPLSFKQSFNLADHVKVVGANVEHGLLTIDLEREVPEQLKPRRIDIGARADAKDAKSESQPKQIDTGAQKAA
jgi:molecular chaperone IbpA